jgi:hypothetical protein
MAFWANDFSLTHERFRGRRNEKKKESLKIKGKNEEKSSHPPLNKHTTTCCLKRESTT